MKTLIGALALAASLFAAQAHATIYNFSFTDTSLAAGIYSFSLDTSLASTPARTNPTAFTGVSIFDNGALVATDTINVSNSGALTQSGNRLLTGTNGLSFRFDPVEVVGDGTSLAFTTGSYTTADSLAGGTVAVNVTQGTVSAAPEPNAWVLMLGGVGAMGLMLRRRRRTGVILAE